MPISITLEQAEQVAPDANSLKAAKKLSNVAQWNNAGAHEDWIWGEIKGSAIYQSAINLAQMKCECSCPSFKRPCKHALGLLIGYTGTPSHFQSTDQVPDRVQKWIDKQQKSTEKKQATAENSKPVDLEARQKRLVAREQKVDQGIDALHLWLQDLVRMGLAEARQKNYQLFEQINARLVDAQAAGVVGWLDQLQTALYVPDWQQRSLFWVGRLALLASLWQRRRQLPELMQAELKQLVGFNLAPDQLAALPIESALYWAVGSSEGELSQGKGRYRRQWLWQADRQHAALLLDFAFMGAAFSLPLAVGHALQLDLQWYPAALPVRARLADSVQLSNLKSVAHGQPPAAWSDFSQALAAYAQQLSQSPLLISTLWLVDSVCLDLQAEQLWLVDQLGQRLPLVVTDQWLLLAAVGEQAFCLAAEWDGQQLHGLTVWQQEQMRCL